MFRFHTSSNVWIRRSNLHGTKITAISGIWAPFITNIELTNFEFSSGSSNLIGLYADMWATLSKKLNFTTQITKLPPGGKVEHHDEGG